MSQPRRTQLWLLVLLFVVPMLLAWAYFKFVENDGVSATANHGTLIHPARPLTGQTSAFNSEEVQGKWTYLFVAGSRCEAECQTALYHMRQVRQLTNREAHRVHGHLLLSAQPDAAFTALLNNEHAGLPRTRLAASDAVFQQWLRTDGEAPLLANRIYLVDPLGNLMMFYSADAAPAGMLKDIKRLLKLSQIG